MIPRQVGEAADREVHAVDTAEAQRVAGHLHHHGIHALFDHHREAPFLLQRTDSILRNLPGAQIP